MLLESAVFWLSLALIAYAYVGYPVLLSLLPRKHPARFDLHHRVPVSIIMAVRNEEHRLAAKLQNLAALHYPSELLQIVVVSDGSQDRTNEYLLEHTASVTPVLLPVSVGKAAALNHAVKAATGDVLVFMDVRQVVDPDAVRQLVACFADPGVGAVSGELHLEDENGRPSSEALGVYWKLEKLVRKLESSTGSVVGVTGAIFAMRRELFLPLPAGTLLDDVLTPLHVARAGKRVLFLESAVARDRLFVEPGKEFGRKVRTLTGNYQLLQLAPWLLSPANPLLFRLISHKLLRLVVPFLLVAMLVASGLAGTSLYQIAFGLQLMLYGMAVIGWLLPPSRRFRAFSVPYTFSMLNVAAAMAFYNLLRGRARWT